MKINRRTAENLFCILVYLVYGFSLGLHSRIYVGESVLVPTLFFLANLIMYARVPKRAGDKFIRICVWAMILVILLFNNQNMARSNLIQIWYMCGILIFFLFASKCDEWHYTFINLLIVLGVFYAVMTFVTVISPSFFYSVVVPLFENSGYMDHMIMLYEQGYITGFSQHYSTNAIYLTITLGALVSVALTKMNKAKWAWLLSIFVFAAILFTGKRAHAVFGLIAILSVYYMLSCDKPLKRWFKILFGLSIAIGAFVVLADYIPQLMNVVNRFIETAEKGNLGNGRDMQRALALSYWSDKPWFGIGWDGYKYLYFRTTGVWLNVHCVYIQLLCEVGIIGSIPFFVFFIVSLMRTISLMRKVVVQDLYSEKVRILLGYAIYIQVFFLLYCLTGNPLYDEPTLFTYILGIAISEYFYYNEKYRLKEKRE